jgi:peptidase E
MLCLTSTLHTGNKAGRDLLVSLLADAPEGYSVCYIGAAMGDRKEWGKVTLDFFKKDLKVKNLTAPRLTDKKLDVAEAREAIENADVLYLDGGDTVECVRLARERGVLASFGVAAKNARLVFGLSGGACAAAPYTIGYDDAGDGYIADCLGMGCPLPLDVHDEPDWPEMRALLELVAKDKRKLPHEGIVAPTGSALVVHRDGRLASAGKVPCEKRSLGRGGKWKVEEIPLE